MDSFQITYEGAQYPVLQLQFDGTSIYKVKLGLDELIITKAQKQTGSMFWTSIPEGQQEIADELGKLIDKQQQKSRLNSLL